MYRLDFQLQINSRAYTAIWYHRVVALSFLKALIFHSFYREYGSDENTLNEALIASQYVIKGRETYQKNTFGHGLIMLKQSIIQEKLSLTEVSKHREQSLNILKNAVGPQILTEMLKDLKIHTKL